MRRLKRYEDAIQLGTGIAGALLMAWWLHTRGWAWFEWLPAAILTFFLVAAVWIIVWFVRRKYTYEAYAARTKADLQAGGDGWSRG